MRPQGRLFFGSKWTSMGEEVMEMDRQKEAAATLNSDGTAKRTRQVEYAGKINLYEEDKIAKKHHPTSQDWYGVTKTEDRMVCAICNDEQEKKGILAIHGDNMTELIWKCGCGNFIVSRTYGIQSLKPEWLNG